MASIVPVMTATDVTRIRVRVYADKPETPTAQDVADLVEASRQFFVAAIRDTVPAPVFALYEELGLLDDAVVFTSITIASIELKGSFRGALIGALATALLAGPITKGVEDSIYGQAVAATVKSILDAPYHAGASVADDAGPAIEETFRRYAEQSPPPTYSGYRVVSCSFDGHCVYLEMTPNRWNRKGSGDFTLD